MSAATNITQILNCAEAINPKLSARLVTCGVASLTARSKENLPDTYAFPLFIRGAARDQHMKKLPTAIGGYEYDIFDDCIISVELFANRIIADPDVTYLAAVYDRLGDLATRTRYCFRFNARPDLNALLDFHHIDPMIPLADVVGYDEERKIDRYTLAWRCIMGIKPDAWPTDASGYVLP